MKTLLILLLTLSSTHLFADTYVKGYTRKNGTYVQPHYRSNSDGNKNNNWTTKGNYNPYTGQEGTKERSNSYYNTYPNSNNNNSDYSK